jgi:hypothetical protein
MYKIYRSDAYGIQTGASNCSRCQLDYTCPDRAKLLQLCPLRSLDHSCTNSAIHPEFCPIGFYNRLFTQTCQQCKFG